MAKIVYDEVGDQWVEQGTTITVPGPVPTQRYRYKVAHRRSAVDGKAIPWIIEGWSFDEGTVLGEGTVTRDYPCQYCDFEQAEGLKGTRKPPNKSAITEAVPEGLITRGHIAARLVDGRIVAEPID